MNRLNTRFYRSYNFLRFKKNALFNIKLYGRCKYLVTKLSAILMIFYNEGLLFFFEDPLSTLFRVELLPLGSSRSSSGNIGHHHSKNLSIKCRKAKNSTRKLYK